MGVKFPGKKRYVTLKCPLTKVLVVEIHEQSRVNEQIGVNEMQTKCCNKNSPHVSKQQQCGLKLDDLSIVSLSY